MTLAGRQVVHILIFGSAATLVACNGPFGDGRPDASLQSAVNQAIDQEMQSLGDARDPAGAEPPTLQTTQPHSDVLEALANRRQELEALGPLGEGTQARLELGDDLTGRPQQRIELSLQGAIASAINRNLDIEAARLEPQISAAELEAAEAVFDWLLFGNLDFTKTDEPQFVPVISGFPLGTAFAASETTRYETGVRKRFEPGTEVSVSTDLTRFQNNAPGIAFSPNPAYTAAVRLGVDQPLLRGFGTEVGTATIRIAANQRRRSEEQLRADLLRLTADAEQAYWDLVRAWRELAIAEWLVEVGIDVRETLAGRRELDVTAAEYSDAVARVEQRRAEVIRAQRRVRAASDTLKVLINDPAMTVSSEAVLFPTEQTVEAPITYNLREAVLSALDNRPELEQAELNLDDAGIRERVAKNEELPLLDLTAQMSFVGLEDDVGSAYGEISDRFVDYVVGLVFEFPIGNNAAQAELRAARLRRSSAALNYRRTVQEIVRDVKSALRDVITSYQLIEATRSFRVAQAENLRALMVQEETLAGLTPEFLNLKFTRQETLAEARRQEVTAIVNFDKSLAELYRAMGISLRMNKVDVEVERDAESDEQ